MMPPKLDTEILMRINPHEIKNIEFLRSVQLDHIPLFEIFERLTSGYEISKIRCGQCGAIHLAKNNTLFCFNCDQ